MTRQLTSLFSLNEWPDSKRYSFITQERYPTSLVFVLHRWSLLFSFDKSISGTLLDGAFRSPYCFLLLILMSYTGHWVSFFFYPLPLFKVPNFRIPVVCVSELSFVLSVFNYDMTSFVLEVLSRSTSNVMTSPRRISFLGPPRLVRRPFCVESPVGGRPPVGFLFLLLFTTSAPSSPPSLTLFYWDPSLSTYTKSPPMLDMTKYQRSSVR